MSSIYAGVEVCKIASERVEGNTGEGVDDTDATDEDASVEEDGYISADTSASPCMW